LLDAARQIAGAGSVVVGAYALVFALLALRDGAVGQLLDYGLVVAALVAANVALAALRHRRRHYG
ncbi:MAG TPA: hypothetical protein VLA98_11980, partial [Solirubrobacteraceae bacterium]|nr:hypothetical protein [Solirubrobacteraceae bacterium]